ncbi:MAG: diguanylate cyclase domain-containing protein [Actinomycetota bacterium]|nr:GGDEF domain-containing protein [Actinomycetota bacterium]
MKRGLIYGGGVRLARYPGEVEARGPFLIRAAAIGVKMTWLVVAAGLAFVSLWRPGESYAPVSLIAILIAGGAGALIVSRLNWRVLIDNGRALGVFHVWSVTNIFLVTLAIHFTGAGRSELFAMYGLTTIFFAAVFPRRDQMGLLAFTILCYVAVISLHGWDIEPSTFIVRLASLTMLASLGSFLSGELVQQVSQHRHDSLHDPLTGVANRALFMDRAEQALALAERHDHKTAVMMLDLDGFKQINDTMGHAAGDGLLKEVAARLSGGVLRQTDTVSRFGGDEFAVLLPKVLGLSAALIPAERIAQALSQPIDIDGNLVTLKASIGIAIYPDHAIEIDDLMHKADVSMYASKASRAPFEVHGGLVPGAMLVLD